MKEKPSIWMLVATIAMLIAALAWTLLMEWIKAHWYTWLAS